MSVVLSEHLPLLASAPGGIKKLRGLILELAVRGKLVPQDPKDEPVSELLKLIAHERSRLEAEGVCKKLKPIRPVDVDEHPFSLPDGWSWVRNGNLFSLRKGKVPKDLSEQETEIPYLDIEALDRGNVRRYTMDLAAPRSKDTDILVVCDGSRSGLVLNGRNGAIGSTLAVIESPKIIQPFIKLIFRQCFDRMNSTMKGAAIPHLDTAKLILDVVGLPPLSEQHRIVAKVDELMALCDRLEAEQADAATAHARLVETLLGTLTQSADAADLAANWQRLAEHFDTLFTTEASIDALKQTVLQLAVMGRLVNYGTKKQWQTLRLDTVCSEIVDCPHSTPKWTSTGKICVRTSQFTPGKLDLSSSRFVSEATFAERIARLRPESNDILYSREGGILGVACRVPPGVELCLGQRMMLLRPGRDVASTFLELVLNSPVITALARANTTGGAAPRVNVATVKAYPIPVPTLAEQHRIVAKVDELMALCDRLKADLASARQHQALLADTLIDAALEAA